MGDDFSKPAEMQMPMQMQSGPAYGSVGGLKCSRADTMIIWDWDDTLMCSNDIMNGGGSTPELEALIEKCLTISMSLGETIIVTNADDAWVWDSARRFAPRCLGLLAQVPIISARNKYQNRFPGDGFAWKHETFREIFSSRRLTHGMNLIVLGDSDCEIQAAMTSTREIQAAWTSTPRVDSLRVKTVKFKEAPTCAELCDQQKMMLQELASIVNEEKDSNRNLALRVRSLSRTSPVGSFGKAYSAELGPQLDLTRSLGTAPLPLSCSMGVSMSHSLGQPVMLRGAPQVWETQYGNLGSSYPHNSRPMPTSVYVM